MALLFLFCCCLALAGFVVFQASGFETKLLDSQWAHKTFQKILYLFRGPVIIYKAYEKSHGKPFAVRTPTNTHIMITSQKHVDELQNASRHTLSLHAAAKEWLQPRHTMGFEWHDRRGVEGTGFVTALRKQLQAHMCDLLPVMRSTVHLVLSHELQSARFRPRLYPTMKIAVARTNAIMFFGAALSQHDSFIRAAIAFPEEVIATAELLRLVPRTFVSIISFAMTRGHQSERILYSVLESEVEARMDMVRRERTTKVKDPDRPEDCMQWLIDTAPKVNPWSCKRMVGEILAVWFGTVHQVSMAASFAVFNLCDHPEYIEPLREEARVETERGKVGCEDTSRKLDSFLKESYRTASTDAVSIRRKIIEPFSFSDGITGKKGDWICVPQAAMMNDALYFAQPERFDGFRFCPRDAGEAGSRYTDTEPHGLFWGAKRMACPGRFYASSLLKIILSSLLLEYDNFSLENGQRSRSFSWRSSVVPSANVRVRLELRTR